MIVFPSKATANPPTGATPVAPAPAATMPAEDNSSDSKSPDDIKSPEDNKSSIEALRERLHAKLAKKRSQRPSEKLRLGNYF
jgi:hypothetical protein